MMDCDVSPVAMFLQEVEGFHQKFVGPVSLFIEEAFLKRFGGKDYLGYASI